MNVIITIALVMSIVYGLTIFVLLYGMRHRHIGTCEELKSVTVIIAARNEAANIGTILMDLVRQNYPTDRFQVIVANDHSTDATAEIVRTFTKERSNFELINMGAIPPNFSPKKYALQEAVRSAKGEIILATDADCRVGPEWIKSMVSYFEKDVGFVIGFSQFGARGEKQCLIEKMQAFDFATMMGVAVGSTNLGMPLAASGQNLGYRKSAFEQVGGYERVAHRVSGDDVLLLQLVRKYTNWGIVFAGDPRSFAVSQPQPTVKDFINQRKRWASNGGYQLKLNKAFFFFLLQVLVYNAALFAGCISALVSGVHLITMLVLLAIRLLLEFTISLRSAVYFGRTDLLIYFPLWFIMQIPYIVGVGLSGTFGKFQWKQRTHRAEMKEDAVV